MRLFTYKILLLKLPFVISLYRAFSRFYNPVKKKKRRAIDHGLRSLLPGRTSKGYLHGMILKYCLIMKKQMNIPLALLGAGILLSLSSCELVGDIFEAGVWFGVLGVIAVIALIFFLVRKR